MLNDSYNWNTFQELSAFRCEVNMERINQSNNKYQMPQEPQVGALQDVNDESEIEENSNQAQTI